MSELSQYDPELRVSRVKDLPNKGLLIIRNTPRDVIILQNENKMKACLGKNLNISLPKAYQNKEKSRTLIVKGVPNEFADEEFKQVLDYNKINHAKAERMKSRRDNKMLQMFQIELNCETFGCSAKNCKAKIKCVICGEGHSHKGCPNREKKQPKCANRKGPHVANYKACPAYKKQVFRQHVVDSQKSYASILKQTRPSLRNPRVTHSLSQPIN